MRHNDEDAAKSLQLARDDHSKNTLFWKAGRLAEAPEDAPPAGAVEEVLVHQPDDIMDLLAANDGDDEVDFEIEGGAIDSVPSAEPASSSKEAVCPPTFAAAGSEAAPAVVEAPVVDAPDPHIMSRFMALRLVYGSGPPKAWKP